MRTKEEILKDIENTKASIEQEKGFNPNNGELSFYYYLLGSLQDELKELEEGENND